MFSGDSPSLKPIQIFTALYLNNCVAPDKPLFLNNSPCHNFKEHHDIIYYNLFLPTIHSILYMLASNIQKLRLQNNEKLTFHSYYHPFLSPEPTDNKVFFQRLPFLYRLVSKPTDVTVSIKLSV